MLMDIVKGELCLLLAECTLQPRKQKNEKKKKTEGAGSSASLSTAAMQEKQLVVPVLKIFLETAARKHCQAVPESHPIPFCYPLPKK